MTIELPEPMYHGPSGPLARDIVYGYTPEQMLAYGEACAKAEREACAKIVDVPDGAEAWEIRGGEEGIELLRDMATAIRAR